MMINQIETGTVELAAEQSFRDRHANGIGQALPKRPGGGFHTRRHAVLGMSRCFGMQLPECLYLVHREIVTGQMQHCVKQH